MKRNATVSPLVTLTISSQKLANESFNCKTIQTTESETNIKTKQMTEFENSVDYTKTPLYDALRPMIYCLKIFGFHYVKVELAKGNVKQLLLKLYCWLVTSVTLAVLALNLFSLKQITGFGPTLVLFTASIANFALCAMNALCFIFAAEYPKALRKFFFAFSDLSKYGGSFTSVSWLRELSISYCIIFWVSWAFGIAFVFYIIFSGQLFVTVYPTDNISDPTLLQVISVASALLLCYLIGCWILINGLQIILGVLIYNEFKLFNAAFSSKVDNDRRFQDSLENVKGRYLIMTRIVEAADCTLSLHQVASFVCDIINICLQLYYVCYYSSMATRADSVGYVTFGLTVSIVDVAIICTSGILVIQGVSTLVN